MVQPSMPGKPEPVRGIFISYRHSDAEGWAGRLRDSLERELRVPVFIDTEAIPLGVDFATYIDEWVQSALAVIAVIGPHWRTATTADGRRRLEDPSDFVRAELACALKHGIPVIPILVAGADPLSPHELPDDLEALSKLQAYTVTGSDWAHDCRKLADGIRALIGSPSRIPQRKVMAYLIIAAILVSLGIGTTVWIRHQTTTAPSVTIRNASCASLPADDLYKVELSGGASGPDGQYYLEVDFPGAKEWTGTISCAGWSYDERWNGGRSKNRICMHRSGEPNQTEWNGSFHVKWNPPKRAVIRLFRTALLDNDNAQLAHIEVQFKDCPEFNSFFKR